MINFKGAEHYTNWRMVTDNVMGGQSTAHLITQHKMTVFAGEISKENNGGFSAVYRAISGQNPEQNMIKVDVQGDGKSYQLRLVCLHNNEPVAYTHDLQTTNKKRKQHYLNISDFKPIYRGQSIQAHPINLKTLIEVGFLLTYPTPSNYLLTCFGIYFITNNCKAA